jgi:enoyl-CoA hydratase/carnithine racemase
VSLVEFRVDDAVGIITLQNPPMNALSAAVTSDLVAAVTAAEDPAIRAVVVTGSPHFAAGADITEFRTALESGGGDTLANRLGDAVVRLEALAKPVIAAVHGFALGGGLEIAMGCDFRFLAEDAKVGQPEIKLGIIPGAGGTQRLTRLVGTALARELVYSGRFVEPEEAIASGLADKVFPADALLDETLQHARAWTTGPTAAIGLAKRAINEGWGLPLGQALDVERAAFDEVFGTADAAEGVDAFLGKRSPDFSGR